RGRGSVDYPAPPRGGGWGGERGPAPPEGRAEPGGRDSALAATPASVRSSLPRVIRAPACATVSPCSPCPRWWCPASHGSDVKAHRCEMESMRARRRCGGLFRSRDPGLLHESLPQRTVSDLTKSCSP